MLMDLDVPEGFFVGIGEMFLTIRAGLAGGREITRFLEMLPSAHGIRQHFLIRKL
jgi:hypothetical protein